MEVDALKLNARIEYGLYKAKQMGLYFRRGDSGDGIVPLLGRGVTHMRLDILLRPPFDASSVFSSFIKQILTSITQHEQTESICSVKSVRDIPFIFERR